ncbi:unnamed protein product, partial [Discosporangium mesarthrocarpum]
DGDALTQGIKRNHGIGFQGVVLPSGIIADLWGPTAGGCHEDYLTRRSRLNDRLRDVQEGNPAQTTLVGTTLVGTLPVQYVPREEGIQANCSWAQPDKSRPFAHTHRQPFPPCNLLGSLVYKRNSELMQDSVGDLYLVEVLLTIIHTCKYGSQVTEHNCELPPFVKAYFHPHGHSSG